jgi:ABC-type antimicrobial peptide transport system permease subunit
MNPLSPLTYYRRHKRGTFLLLALISLMTLGVCVMVRLPDTLLEHMYYSESYVTRVSMVSASGTSLAPGIVAQIRSHPDVAQVIQEKGLDISLPPISGSYHLFGVSEADMQTMLRVNGLRLKEGRLPQPHANELVLSESMAKASKVWLGDEIVSSRNEGSSENWFAAIPTPLMVVGILESDPVIEQDQSPPVGLVSYEYVNSHALFTPPWTSGLAVIAEQGRSTVVEDFLETEISVSAPVRTGHQLIEKVQRTKRNFHLVFGMVDLLVAIAVALVVSIINQIALSRRMNELGVLHALGINQKQLLRRLTLETGVVAVLGWILGLALSWLFFSLLKNNLYEPNGVYLDLTDFAPVWFSALIPFATVTFAAMSIRRTFSQFDAVAIIERGKLSTEERKGREFSKRTGMVSRSRVNPLSSRVFYLRHPRRGLALILAMGLMIMGVAFPMFIFAPMIDAWAKVDEHLKLLTIVSPRLETKVDPGVTAQIKAHDDVKAVIPAIRMWTDVDVPPMAHPNIPLYGVSESDLQALIELYEVRVEAGRFPQSRSNEIIITKAFAQNRNLHVGDTLGETINPVKDKDIPTELLVVGILTSPSDQQDLWTGFGSLEYMQIHENYAFRSVHLLVVPKEGRKSDFDTWLEENVDSQRTAVLTFEGKQEDQQIGMYALLAIIGILESVIAVVAAVALAILSYVFFIQRRQEYGILRSIGHSKAWLALRTMKESISIIMAAWLIGAVLCGIGLVIMQYSLYIPKGLSLNLLNPAPWLFTIPMPLAVITVSLGLVIWMLSRLDPVAIIERR